MYHIHVRIYKVQYQSKNYGAYRPWTWAWTWGQRAVKRFYLSITAEYCTIIKNKKHTISNDRGWLGRANPTDIGVENIKKKREGG